MLALTLHELYRAITCLFLSRDSRYNRWQIKGNTEKVKRVLSATFLIVFITIIYFYTSVEQNQQFFQVFITAGRDITTIIN